MPPEYYCLLELPVHRQGRRLVPGGGAPGALDGEEAGGQGGLWGHQPRRLGQDEGQRGHRQGGR